MKPRSFKLIKNYPGSSALNTVFTSTEDGKLYKNWGTYLDPADVEDNPEFFKEIIEKKYEILSFKANKDLRASFVSENAIAEKAKSGYFHYLIQNYTEEILLKDSSWSIHSIRRLSDNEVFSIGDKVDSTISDLGRATDITGFKIKNDKLIVGLRHLGYYPLSTIILPKPVLFVTEDGKEIKTGGEYWYVVASDSAAIPWRWKALHDVANWTHETEAKKPPLGCYQFFSKAKAQEWIVFNKPCLSLMEATLAIQRTSLFYKEKDSIVENLKKLVESKL